MKLSKLQVASFPWDPPPPQPAPAPAAAPAAPGPTQQVGTPTYTTAQLSPPPNAQPLPLANGLPGANGLQVKPEAGLTQDPMVKTEPGLPGTVAAQYAGNPNGPNNVAAQRAMHQLQNQYGAAAAASISAIQGFGQAGAQGASVPRPTGTPVHPAQPQTQPQTQPQPQRTPSQAQYAQQMANRAAVMQQQQQQPPPQAPATYPAQPQEGFQQSQVDGAGDDFEGVLMRRHENGETSEMGRVDIDRMLHQQIAAKAKQLEGGGLMLPLKQATKHKSIANKTGPSGSGFDGVDDDVKREEDDEDAINSDLDDPNEVDIGEEDDDDNMDQVMLCMYDKVQRVKNKWCAPLYRLINIYSVIACNTKCLLGSAL